VRYDISSVPPSLYDTATLNGTFSGASYNGPGIWTIYGVDDDAEGNNWEESTVNYATAAGVDPSADINSFGIADAAMLGTITLDGEDIQPLPFSSNTEDLDLTSFLEGDTDGKVTFIIMSETQDELEYRIDSKEGNSSDGHGPMTLNFAAPLAITDISLTSESSVVLNWAGPSKRYFGVERTVGLTPSDWVPLASNLVAYTYADTAPAAAQAFYRVVDEGPRPAIEFFLDDFESGVGDWQTRNGATHEPGTDWQRGYPTWGPGYASSGTNAWGTNLENFYGPNADTSLLSPIIDLSSATTANLTFNNFFDFDEAGDSGSIYVRDSSGAEIPGLEAPIATYEGLTLEWDWAEATVALPRTALGQAIRLEFRFVSDESVDFYAGWYIDDVRVHE
jgi:hypothetical protein